MPYAHTLTKTVPLTPNPYPHPNPGPNHNPNPNKMGYVGKLPRKILIHI